MTLQSLSLAEAFLRVGLAVFFGFIIGFDRDRKNKPVDLRAYIIVAVATCVLCLLSSEMVMSADKLNGADYEFDLARILSGALTGIGFLGAGAIIKTSDNVVIGSATGASIWACGVIGICLGFGYYTLAFLCFLAVFLTLFLGGFFFENFMGKTDHEEKTKLS